ncbi:MAG: hypothetical protein JKX74_02320 [Flavobacteriales bacterium]|nr:hypothetical protein [Flavobacteriales bacterium]
MNNRILIVLILLLGLVAGYLYFKEDSSTIKPELRDFAIADTATVTKIFLADKARKTITLTRSANGRWKVNDSFFARRDLIKVLLKTIHLLEVKSPVSKASRSNVITRLASGATKVEIYQGGEQPVKVYYVGGATQSTMGTFMLLEGSSQPFITHVPSFFGYLSTRYTTNLLLWRDKTILDMQFKDMKSVRLEFPGDQQYSFSVINKGKWDFELKALEADSVIEDYDTVALRVYLTGFKNIQFEGFETGRDQPFIDSIFNAIPVHILTVESLEGEVTYVESFLKPDTENRVDMYGEPIIYDVDRLYGRINDNSELVTIQYFTFDNIIFGLRDFLKNQEEPN